eukprot:Ihof_evm2s311 gene=Ihof_evmTU2s311
MLPSSSQSNLAVVDHSLEVHQFFFNRELVLVVNIVDLVEHLGFKGPKSFNRRTLFGAHLMMRDVPRKNAYWSHVTVAWHGIGESGWMGDFFVVKVLLESTEEVLSTLIGEAS